MGRHEAPAVAHWSAIARVGAFTRRGLRVARAKLFQATSEGVVGRHDDLWLEKAEYISTSS